MKLEFSPQIFEKAQISSLIKIHEVRAELFHVDGWTDRHDDANSHFLQFCEHTYKWTYSLMCDPNNSVSLVCIKRRCQNTPNLSLLSFCYADFSEQSRFVLPHYQDHPSTESMYWNFLSIHKSHMLSLKLKQYYF
jgi:CTP:phosphocholine cytidylyltransferase-like protein